MTVLIDVTDLVEFLQRRESVSGVQRVVAETAPLLTRATKQPRASSSIGHGVSSSPSLPLSSARSSTQVREHQLRSTDDATRPDWQPQRCNADSNAQAPITIDTDTTCVFLGALWINDALMPAARAAHARGARIVSLLYDLTPVMETGHTAAVNKLFDRYLTLLLQCASRVPAISRVSRRDFEEYAHAARGHSPRRSRHRPAVRPHP